MCVFGVTTSDMRSDQMSDMRSSDCLLSLTYLSLHVCLYICRDRSIGNGIR